MKTVFEIGSLVTYKESGEVYEITGKIIMQLSDGQWVNGYTYSRNGVTYACSAERMESGRFTVVE